MADHAGAADAVDHVNGLAEVLLQQHADDARGGVGAAPCAPRTDQLDRPGGIGFLCERWIETEGLTGSGGGREGCELTARYLGHGVPSRGAGETRRSFDAAILGSFVCHSQDFNSSGCCAAAVSRNQRIRLSRKLKRAAPDGHRGLIDRIRLTTPSCTKPVNSTLTPAGVQRTSSMAAGEVGLYPR